MENTTAPIVELDIYGAAPDTSCAQLYTLTLKNPPKGVLTLEQLQEKEHPTVRDFSKHIEACVIQFEVQKLAQLILDEAAAAGIYSYAGQRPAFFGVPLEDFSDLTAAEVDTLTKRLRSSVDNALGKIRAARLQPKLTHKES
jgi:hypothetical protein